MKRAQDEVDGWCKDWAVQRRKALGIEEFRAREVFFREEQEKKKRWTREWAKQRALAPDPDKFTLLSDYLMAQAAQEDKTKSPGYLSPLKTLERLGKLRSTLGQIQKERVSAGERSVRMGENGHRFQDWPEVYKGTSLLVHRAYILFMPGDLREIMHLHYVWWEIAAKDKCPEIGIEVTQYWVKVGSVKSFVRGAVLAMDSHSEVSGQPAACVL